MKKRLSRQEKDVLVVSALRENSRQTLAKISRQTTMPLSTIHDRIKALKKKSIIKYTALVDFSAMGYNTRACLLLKVDKSEREKLKEYLAGCTQVNWLAKINNGHDFLVEVVFKHIKDMEDYIEQLDHKFNVEKMETFYIIEDIKKEEFLANPIVEKIKIR